MRTVLPAPVTFPGMPAPRFWAFEDARIDLGAVGAGADNVARMLLDRVRRRLRQRLVRRARRAARRVAHPHRRHWTCTDTFGVTSRGALGDRGRRSRPPAWRMFGLVDRRRQRRRALLFLPPVLAGSLEAAGPRACGVRPRRVRQPRVGDRGARRVSDRSTTTSRRGAATTDPHERGRRRRAALRRWPPRRRGTGTRWSPCHRRVRRGDARAAGDPSRLLGTVLGDRPSRSGSARRSFPAKGFGVERTFQLARWMGGRTAAVVGPPAHRRQRAGVERPALRRRPVEPPAVLFIQPVLNPATVYSYHLRFIPTASATRPTSGPQQLLESWPA